MWDSLFTVLAFCALWVPAQDSTEAMLAIQDAIQADDLIAASELIDKSLASHPYDGGVLNLRGVVHARRKKLTQARADFDEAVRLSPQLTPAWQNLARACQQLEQAPCAVNAWQRVLRSQPGNAEAHAALARLYVDQQKFAEAWRQLLGMKGDELEVRCLALSGLGRTTEAKEVAARLAKQRRIFRRKSATHVWPARKGKSGGSDRGVAGRTGYARCGQLT